MTTFFDTLAITGGIGSGKSTVLQLFENHGFEVVNVDLLGHTLLFNTSPYYQQYCLEIDNLLGTNYCTKTEINRTELRNLLLNTPDGFQKIGDIAEKYIILLMKEIYAEKTEKNIPIIFEVPLLVEQNLHHLFSKVLVIVADINVRIERIKLRDPHLTDKDIQNRLSIQSSDQEKTAVAHYVIDNSGNKEQLIEQFNLFLEQYRIDTSIQIKQKMLQK